MDAGYVIRKKGISAGRLERTRTGGRFAYDESWSGLGIAHRLPVRDAPYETPNVPSLPTYFVNILPESAVLQSLSRREKVAHGDLVGMLGLLGEDAVGDITVEEIGDSIRKVVAAWPPTAIDLILQFAFDYLVGNGDQHGKNVGVRRLATACPVAQR